MRRVALIGSSSTGKTTVYNLLKQELPDFVFVNESTRTVGNLGFPINEEGTSETQLAISSYHLEALLTQEPLLLDRCYLDLVVYTRLMPGVSKEVLSFIESTWSRVKKQYTDFIYFPIEFRAVDDGIRSTNEEWRKSIDKEFQRIFEEESLEYLVVKGSPFQRVEQIKKYIKN